MKVILSLITLSLCLVLFVFFSLLRLSLIVIIYENIFVSINKISLSLYKISMRDLYAKYPCLRMKSNISI
jgi:hypothetical protein